MLVDEMPRSFVKRNNSYSHCPLKKRPVHVMLAADDASSDPIKDEIIVDDVLPEPENLSTKPEDLSRAAVSHKTPSESNIHLLQSNYQTHNNNNNNNNEIKIELKRSPSPLTRSSPSSSPSRTSSPSPPSSPLLLPSAIKLGVIQNENENHHNHQNRQHNHHHHHHQNPGHQMVQSSHHHHHHNQNHNHQNQHRHQSSSNFPAPKSSAPQSGVATPLHPVPKKARVEILQHESGSPAISVQVVVGGGGGSGVGVGVGPQSSHYLGTGVVSSSAPSALEPLNLNTPVEPLARYASTPSWASRAAPLFPPHYLPYPSAGFARYPGAPGGPDLYPAYPVPSGYSHPSSPERATASSPPHAALPRPVARTYAPWGSPEHCGLSPTGSLGSGSLRSPPPVSPEDLSSPGSDSGRSSAGSTSAGPVGASQKVGEKSGGGPRYQCPDCGKSYSTYSGLSKHQQFHCAAAEGQAKKSFSCKYCEKVYVSLGALKMHIRTHTLPCKCHLCGKAFSRPWLLQGHIRTHTGEKPFSCQHCNRAFADRSNLRAHLQTHSDVKKYSCSSCSKTFSRMSLLTKHQEGGCPGVAVPIAYAC